MCPWEHQVQTSDDGTRQFCMEVCRSCGDMDFCEEPDHPHSGAEQEGGGQ